MEQGMVVELVISAPTRLQCVTDLQELTMMHCKLSWLVVVHTTSQVYQAGMAASHEWSISILPWLQSYKLKVDEPCTDELPYWIGLASNTILIKKASTDTALEQSDNAPQQVIDGVMTAQLFRVYILKKLSGVTGLQKPLGYSQFQSAVLFFNGKYHYTLKSRLQWHSLA